LALACDLTLGIFFVIIEKVILGSFQGFGARVSLF
jgi:hypothetical protein